MTRSSLLLLLQCFPTSFACFLGSSSGELVPASGLAEPVWAGLLHWYLPFVIIILALYIPPIIAAHVILINLLRCKHVMCPMDIWGGAGLGIGGLGQSPLSISLEALRLAAHGLIDVPIPIGILHAWITVLEVRMNGLVSRLSAQYHELGNAVPESTLVANP